MSIIEINWRPERRTLRNFGLISLCVFGALGAWIFFKRTIFGADLSEGAARITAMVLWIVAGYSGLMSVMAPTAVKPVYLLLTAIGLPIGFVVSHIVMGVIYYLVFTPVGLIFRLIGRDALNRKLEADAETYWVERRQAKDVKRYFRQF